MALCVQPITKNNFETGHPFPGQINTPIVGSRCYACLCNLSCLERDGGLSSCDYNAWLYEHKAWYGTWLGLHEHTT